MSNEQAGIFIKSLYYYRINNTLPDLDFGLEMALTPFINQLKRDEDKWFSIAERNKQNGSKGGRPQITQNNPNNPVGFSITQNNPDKPRKPVNGNVSVNVNDNGNVSENDNKKINTKNLDFLSGVEQDIFDDWLSYKSERKESYKPTGLKSLITQLKKHKENGCNIVEAINVAMSNNWKGIIWEKGNNVPDEHQKYLKDLKREFPYTLYIISKSSECDYIKEGMVGGFRNYIDEDGDITYKYNIFSCQTEEEGIKLCQDLQIDYKALQEIDLMSWHDSYDGHPDYAHKYLKIDSKAILDSDKDF